MEGLFQTEDADGPAGCADPDVIPAAIDRCSLPIRATRKEPLDSVERGFQSEVRKDSACASERGSFNYGVDGRFHRLRHIHRDVAESGFGCDVKVSGVIGWRQAEKDISNLGDCPYPGADPFDSNV